MSSVAKIINFIGTFIILATLISSIITSSFRKIKHFKLFFIYPLLEFILSVKTVSSHFFVNRDIKISHTFESIFLILENLFWGILFIIFFSKKKNAPAIYIIFGCSLFIILSLIIQNNISSPNFKVSAISNLTFSIYCILYFSKIFQERPILSLYKEPSFWVFSGLLFYSILSLPLFPIADYELAHSTSRNILLFFSIINVQVIVMHIFFIKGILCSIHQHRAS